MKKITFLLLCLFLVINAKSQILFSEDFDGISGTTAGGAGTYSFPSGWIKVNADNLTPAASVSYVNEAWERREDFNFNVADSCAFSTSWYSPAGTSDDWMWTPLISGISSITELSWNAVTYDPLYQDGYEVRVMVAPTSPTGSTGNIGNMVTNSTIVFSTLAEASSWTSHTVNLSAFAGQSIYIGFRNNTYDKFLLLIDDVVVSNPNNYDATIVSIDTISEYLQIPISQTNQPYTMGAKIKNNGTMPVTNVKLAVDVLNSSFATIFSDTSIAISSLASGVTTHVSLSPYSPNTIGKYYFKYKVIINEADNNASNDTLSNYWGYRKTDSTYARDNGIIISALGIGAGNGGYMGQDFEIMNQVDLTSITLNVSRGYIGKNLAAVIWDMVAGVPNAIIASTDTLVYPNDSAATYTLGIYGPNHAITLNPGRYAVTMVEFDSTLSVSQTSSLHINGRSWVNWPTTPMGGWANAEDFGASFAKAFCIRMNFNACYSISVSTTAVNASCSGCSDGSATATVIGGTGPFTYTWSNGGTTATITNLPTGLYHVTVVDANGCYTTATDSISFSVAINEITNSNIIVYPNPSNGSFNIEIPAVINEISSIEIIDIYGRIIAIDKEKKNKFHFDGIATGVYTLRINSKDAVFIKSIIVQ
ncbi:MAG: T9SS type A sorting domain-containing protein [Bacteroidetes bacterium]|nr:T9SS type A sorting domain-containing protein [Bacteroidota bacterium]